MNQYMNLLDVIKKMVRVLVIQLQDDYTLKPINVSDYYYCMNKYNNNKLNDKYNNNKYNNNKLDDDILDDDILDDDRLDEYNNNKLDDDRLNDDILDDDKLSEYNDDKLSEYNDDILSEYNDDTIYNYTNLHKYLEFFDNIRCIQNSISHVCTPLENIIFSDLSSMIYIDTLHQIIIGFDRISNQLKDYVISQKIQIVINHIVIEHNNVSQVFYIIDKYFDNIIDIYFRYEYKDDSKFKDIFVLDLDSDFFLLRGGNTVRWTNIGLLYYVKKYLK